VTLRSSCGRSPRQIRYSHSTRQLSQWHSKRACLRSNSVAQGYFATDRQSPTAIILADAT
jgi:hypothetical protein